MKHYLILILVIGAFLRMILLTDIPPGFFVDPASIGYDVYSLIKTGSDRFGNPYPFLFYSLNDYLPPLFHYSLIPIVYMFGLSEFSVRLGSVIYGLLAILAVYLMAKEFFNEKVGLLSAFFVAISPWLVHTSRTGLLENTFPFLLALSLYFIKKSLKNRKFAIFAVASSALTIYSYAIPKLFLPLLLAGFLFIYKKAIFKNYRLKHIMVYSLIFLLFVFPIYYSSFLGKANQRFSQVSILNWPSPAKHFFSNYVAYFNPAFLFLGGPGSDPLVGISPPRFGKLYIFESILVIIGLFEFVRKRKREHLFFLYWFFIYPIAGSLVFGAPHSLRGLTGSVMFHTISAVGLLAIVKKLHKKIKYLILIISIVILINLIFVFKLYFIEYKIDGAMLGFYGLGDAIRYVDSIKDDFDNVVVTENIFINDHRQLETWTLFFTKYDPIKFQKKGLEKYKFCKLYNFSCYNPNQNNVYLVLYNELPNSNALKEFYYPDGKPRYKIVTSKQLKEQAACENRCVKKCSIAGRKFKKIIDPSKCLCSCHE